MMNLNDFGQFQMNNDQTENTVGGTCGGYRRRRRRRSYSTCYSYSSGSCYTKTYATCGTPEPTPTPIPEPPVVEPTPTPQISASEIPDDGCKDGTCAEVTEA